MEKTITSHGYDWTITVKPNGLFQAHAMVEYSLRRVWADTYEGVKSAIDKLFEYDDDFEREEE